MRAKGIFFDLYGTLLVYGNMKQAWSDWLSTFYDLLKTRGLKISKDTFSQECNGFFSTAAPAGDSNNLTTLERRIHSLVRRLDHELDTGELRHIADTIAQAWQTNITLDPEAIRVLTALKQNKRIGLVSNFDHPPHVRRILSANGLQKFFEVIAISSEVGVKKPDPAIFAFALEQTRLSPAEVVYVGDTDEDVAGAIAAGIHPIFIQRPVNPTARNALDYQTAYPAETFSENMYSKNKVKVIKCLTEILDIT